ncbi:MAG: phosphoenolpyruvate carboxylase, partial [Amphiplicatus sp.]
MMNERRALAEAIAAPAPEAPVADWTAFALARLKAYERESAVDPLTNSVRRLAYDFADLEAKGGIDAGRLAALAKAFSDEALIARADEFGARHRDSVDIDALLAPLDGAPFATVKAALERARAGIVFTAHPTFAMSRALRRAFAARAEAADETARSEAAAAVAELPHAPDTEISLVAEHEDAQKAILRAQESLRAIVDAMLVWAQARYPADWTLLAPAPLSLATWVGYDLDGRTDIHWGQTFTLRLQEKSLQLRRYAETLRGMKLESARSVAAQLESAAAFASEQAAKFSGDLSDPDVVTEAANLLTRADPRRLVSLGPIIEALAPLIDSAPEEARRALVALRAEMKNYGLGIARIHLRINAAQVRSALRADLGLDPARDFIDRTALDAAAKKAGAARRRNINVASIFLEQMTARRQFMLCAEFLKHIDADTPIRFLIAECEAPATVMGAIYLARLYGVERRIDISPLFETPEAIERGGRFLERLLAEPEFVAYIRSRGRIAIQLGFSDSGRFMGQVAADLAIERLQILLARGMTKADVTDIEAVIFNTHGESMGRGGFPGALQDRFDYLMTPWARAKFAHEHISINAESSFQGGDGYLHFETPRLAVATVASLLKWSFAEPTADKNDRYYEDINFSWDVYRAVKAWQEALFDNPDYHVTIGAFAPGMLVATGSRRVRRQSGGVVTGPRALRAIPHNAILQQLAAPVNVCGGAGSAGGAEPDRIIELIRSSPRMTHVMHLARRARALTSLPVLRGYAILFDASFWVSMAIGARDSATARMCEEIGERLCRQETPTGLNRLANRLAADLAKLDRISRELYGEHVDAERHERRRSMHALHAIRQAMIMRALLLTAGLPAFSSRHDVSRASIFDLAFELRLDDLAELLETIFPAVNAEAFAFGGVEEPADDLGESVKGYPEIHARIIAPLREIHRDIR